MSGLQDWSEWIDAVSLFYLLLWNWRRGKKQFARHDIYQCEFHMDLGSIEKWIVSSPEKKTKKGVGGWGGNKRKMCETKRKEE